MTIKWEGDRQLAQALRTLQQKSDSAAAQALTGLAFDVRQQVRNELPTWLKLTRAFLPNSVVYEKATETNLSARVGFHQRADFATLLEEGGERKPTSSQAIAVPTNDVRRTNKGGISAANRPKAQLQKKNVFSGRPENAPNAASGIWRAVKKTGLTLLYIYKDSTRYRTKFMKFKDTAEQVVKANHEKRFEAVITRMINKM